MSTTITSDHPNGSSGLSSSQDLSHSLRRKNSALRSMCDPTSPTRIFSSLPSLKKSWEQSYSSFQTSTRSQCPRVHYHPWCDDCQTLTEWEQPPPIRPTYNPWILTFGDLKTAIWEKSHYQSLFGSQRRSQQAMGKVCSMWRDEQFARAITKRSTKMAAQEALHQSVHQQHAACGVVQPAT